MDMLDTCSTVVCHTLSEIKSDPYPLLFACNIDKVTLKSKFKFLNMWTLHDDFENIIKDTWNTKIFGGSVFILDKKHRILKH